MGIMDLNWITRLSHLEYLNLEDVYLGYASPTWLQNINMLPSLSELHLPGCNLNHFPQTLPMMNFTSLLVLDLKRNVFNTTIPQWLFNVSTLVSLDLQYCEIQGRLPNGAGFCNLKSLDLSYNSITGKITDFLGSLSDCSNSSLEVLMVSRNSLSGKIPESIGKFKYLRILNFESNSFSGSIPLSIGNLSFLEDLSLYHNQMNGIIPDTIGKLSELVSLDLLFNSWKGVVSEYHFSGLAKLKNFRVSSLRQSLAIDLRHEWVPPFSLKRFIMYDCRWGSTFPLWLKTQGNLSGLALTNAGISGIIPDWIWKLSPQLDHLDLSDNQLEGKLPSELQFRPTALIDFSFNRLEGLVPIWFNVTYMNLNSNLFSGVIPTNSFQEIPVLRSLYLSDNLINGSISTSISRLHNLVALDLSNNHLSGNLHISWDYPKLYMLDLSNNGLYGEIPLSICSHSNLQILALFRNNLSGVPFLALRNCTALEKMDLGENGFSGCIPKWVGKELPRLSTLGLRSNRFSGNIPEELCGLPAFHIMDLAHNKFSGFIPPCLGNLRGLKTSAFYRPYNPEAQYTYFFDEMELVTKGRQLGYTHTVSLVNLIDLSRNNFRGEIPEQITSLAYLGTLNLSQNQLTGKIPEKIGDLQRLETLDLSLNHLSGQIPPSMYSMTLLNSLNLSYNNLSGHIPSANQFNTFNDPSIYEGNSQLCGSPLPTSCSPSTNEDPGFSNDEEEDESWIDMWWFYIAIAPGFVVGFWVVCGTLILKKRWRYAYFQFVDRVKDTIFVVITLNKARLQRKFETER